MSWWDGIVRCWPLSDKCGVTWDAFVVLYAALSAGVAILAVSATVYLGFMTLRLGRVANKASQNAARIAHQSAMRQEQQDRDERLMLLMQIMGEVALVEDHARTLILITSGDTAEENFYVASSVRTLVADCVDELAMPTCAGRNDRLHVIGHPLAARLGRAMGMTSLLTGNFRKSTLSREVHDWHGAWLSVTTLAPLIVAELEIVRGACEQAAKELGIGDADVVGAPVVQVELG